MKTNVIRNIFVFASGALLGSLVTYKVVKEKFEKIADEEIASVKETYEERVKKLPNSITIHTVGVNPETKEVVEKKLVTSQDRYKKIAKTYNQTDINPENAILDPEEVEAEEEYTPEIYNPENANPNPYVISIEQFSEEMDNFDKETLYYYEEDDTLTDDQETIITDITATIGDDALASFGEGSYAEDVVYVRNEKMTTDYEIIRLPKSYQRDVMGIEPVPEKKRKRRRVSDEE